MNFLFFFSSQKKTAVEKNIKPTIKSPLSNVLTRAGQKITLECDIAGKPQPEVYVMHNGKILSDHDVNVSIFYYFSLYLLNAISYAAHRSYARI